MKTINLVVIATLLFLSCSEDLSSQEIQNDLESLPKDKGGVQKAHFLGTTPAVFSHYIYTPSDYTNNSLEYPLLIFLHGSGERGDSEVNPEILKKVLVHGPPKLIESKKWTPKYPMIVASPQLPSGRWKPNDIHNFITYLIANYRINTKRIYLTGLSLGGFGSFNYISTYGSQSYVAAIVPIAGGGRVNSGNKFKNTPVWAFHGDNDNVVSHSQSIAMVNAINKTNPNTHAKLTIYPGVGHDSWTKTYNAEGMGTESGNNDPFDMNIYDWMFLFENLQ